MKRNIYIVLFLFLSSFILTGCNSGIIDKINKIINLEDKDAYPYDDFAYTVKTYEFDTRINAIIKEVSYTPELSTVCVELTVNDSFYREATYAVRLTSTNDPNNLKGAKDQLFDLKKSEDSIKTCFNGLTGGNNYIHLLRGDPYDTFANVLFTLHFNDKDFEKRGKLTSYTIYKDNQEADYPSMLVIDFVVNGEQEAIGTLKLKVFNKNTNEEVHHKEFTKDDLVFEDGIGTLSNYKIENLTPGLEYHVAMLFSPPSNRDEVILLDTMDITLAHMDEYQDILEKEASLEFSYNNLLDRLYFDFSIEADLDDFEFEELILTFKDYHTNEIVKEFVLNDLILNDSFEKPIGLENFKVSLRAKYKYKTVYSDELIRLGSIDKDLEIVGDYDYRELTVGECLNVNTLYFGDIDMFELKINEPGLYTIDSKGNSVDIEIYDSSYTLIDDFYELQLSKGVYYVAIEGFNEGDHTYTVKSLVDDNEGNTVVNLVDGENQLHAFLDYYSDDETFEFTLDQDKIITLGENTKHYYYKILDADGVDFDSNIYEYSSWSGYTYIFPKGTYTIKVYEDIGIIDFPAIVTDVNDDYTNDFDNDFGFGKLSKGENQILLEYKGDQDIYYVDITEKGNYVFEGEFIEIKRIDESGEMHPIYTKKLFELDEGRHYFVFYDRNNHERTTVGIEFNLITDENDENNHVAINIGEQVTSKVNDSLDKDYFDFTISESGVYKIDNKSDSPGVKIDILDEENNLIYSFQYYDPMVTLNEGSYTIMLYQPKMYGNNLKNAIFTITKN